MTENIDTIETLVALAKSGEAEAKEEIYRAYKPLVRSVCSGFYIIGGDREDLLQEGMIGLFDAVESFDASKGSFPAFARLCVRRHILTAVSRAVRDGTNFPVQNLRQPEDAEALSADLSSVDPLEIVVGRDMLSALKEFIATKLTSGEQQALEYFCAGFSYEEICEKTGKGYKSVDAALQRARKKLARFKKGDSL